MVAAVAGLGVLAYGLMQSEDEDAPDDATATEPTTAAFEAEVTETLNAFLEARIAGEGAQQYVDVPEEDVPLLYATTSGAPYERAEFEPVSGIEWQYDWTGAPYERAEFEPVSGIEWPSGETAFKVRLFAGDTMVEQLFFMPHDHRSPTDGHPRLTYQTDGFGTDIAPTTEDGQPLAMPYTAFDGLVTVHIAHPWVAQSPDGPIRLIPEGVGPTTDGGQRNGWERLLLVADPQPGRTFCETFPVPADAEALAEIIESDTDLETTAPEVVRVGEADALIMDVVAVAERGICNHGVPTPPEGERMRLYLFDAPEGSSMRILAIAIVVPEDRFERAVGGAAPVVASVEFHAT
jgi:hypothetical protein